MNGAPYILGRSDSEVRRLLLQAAIFRPITERLLRAARLQEGMRVLDLSCGSGQTAMLAADLVGPTGEVVAIDSNAEVLSIARRCARAAGRYNHVLFHESKLEDFVDFKRYDLIIGRFVLMHQRDPALFIRTAASHLRPGGIIAFHEMAFDGGYQWHPPVPLMQLCWKWILAASNSLMKRPAAATEMSASFKSAGLEHPMMFCEAVASRGPSTPLYSWIALTVRSLLPQILKIGASTAAEVEIETLEDRLQAAALEAQGTILSPLQYCTWAKVVESDVRRGQTRGEHNLRCCQATRARLFA
jgi:ubiquinone/menaquinone biosynthesis C-methylase UbiE